jgi:hypothetical protein
MYDTKIPEYLRRSRLYTGLRMRYFLKHVQPYVLIGAVVWFGWMWQTLQAIAYVQTYYGASVLYHVK